MYLDIVVHVYTGSRSLDYSSTVMLTCFFVVFAHIDRTITLCEGLKSREARYYKVRLYGSRNNDTFVVTEGFKAVWEKLKSGKCKQIAINGPKGVGKSLALAAIATLLRRDGKKCFLWTPDVTDEYFRLYASQVFGKHSLSMVF
jgi:hypothetical protein